jgi:hypothetical protein
LDSAAYIKISFLERKDAACMITESAGDAVSFPPEVVEKILTLTNAHPFYTQFLCLSIFDLALPSGRATVAMVEEAVGRFHGLGADGSMILINNVVSQSVPHLHLHVIPRNFRDGLRFWLGPRHPYDAAARAEAYAERIRAALPPE